MAVYLKVTKILLQAGTYKPVNIEVEMPEDLMVKLELDTEQLKSGAKFVKGSALVEQLLKAVQQAEEAAGEPRTVSESVMPAKQIEDEEELKPSKKASAKGSSLTDDEDDDEKPTKRASKKTPLDDDEDEDEAPAAKKPAKKKAAKVDEDEDDESDDDDDDDDDDDEEEPPAKKSKKAKEGGLAELKKFLAED